MLVFSVRDLKAAVFGTPWFARTRGVAVRNFMAACLQSDHEWCRFAEDYSLYVIGEFDEDLGLLIPLNPVEQLMTAVTALAAGKKAV